MTYYLIFIINIYRFLAFTLYSTSCQLFIKRITIHCL